MRRLLCSSLVAVVALCALPAQAQNFSYNYIDLGVRTGELGGVDASGLGTEASHVIAPNVRLKGAADVLDADNVDATGYNVAAQAGYFTDVAPNIDLVVDAGLLYTDIDIADDTGIKIDGIVRLRVDQRVEVNAGLSYVDIFNDSDTGIHLAGTYAVNPGMALLIRYDDYSETELWSFGVRLSY